jgi:hypothetical protein
MNCPGASERVLLWCALVRRFKSFSTGQCFYGGINDVQRLQSGVNSLQTPFYSTVSCVCICCLQCGTQSAGHARDGKPPTKQDRSKCSLHPVTPGARHTTPFRQTMDMEFSIEREVDDMLCQMSVRAFSTPHWPTHSDCCPSPQGAHPYFPSQWTVAMTQNLSTLLIDQSTDTPTLLSYPHFSLFCCWFVYETVR